MTNVKTFELPQMSSHDYKSDIQDDLTVQDSIDRDVEEMGFEAMKGEEEYVSPEEASPEALKRIKAQKIGGIFTNIFAA